PPRACETWNSRWADKTSASSAWRRCCGTRRHARPEPEWSDHAPREGAWCREHARRSTSGRGTREKMPRPWNKRMTRFAIISQSLVPGDAVGNDVLEMHRVLTRHGHEVALFAGHWELAQPLCRPIAEAGAFLRRDRSSVLIYHHSTGFEAGLALLMRQTC